MSLETDPPPTPADRPQPDGTDIRKMTATEIKPVARALARAFEDDPHFSWILRSPENRLQRLESAFAVFVRRIWFPPDAGYVHERLTGAALWMPPDSWHVGLLTQIWLGPATFRAMRGATPRLLKALNFIERKHPREPSHWYLPIIGVTPAWQGRGYGAALMHPVLERCDQERVPAYLEASTPRNRALYERLGFEVIEVCSYADDAPPMWRMWREPAGER